MLTRDDVKRVFGKVVGNLDEIASDDELTEKREVSAESHIDFVLRITLCLTMVC